MMVEVKREKYREHPKFSLSKFNILKEHLTLMFSHSFTVSFFFQVLFVNGRVDQVMNNVSASWLPSSLLFGTNGARNMAGQIDEVQLHIT